MTNTLEEIGAEQRRERQQIRKDAEVFTSLLAHPGWPRFLALLEAVGANYYGALVTPLENSFECVKAEYAKGALKGLTLAASLPSAKIKEAEELTGTDNDHDA
jgi:hypothetical protein